VTQQFAYISPLTFQKVKVDQIDAVLLASVKKNTALGGKVYALPMSMERQAHCEQEDGSDAKDWTDFLNPKYKGRVSYRLKDPHSVRSLSGSEITLLRIQR